MLSLLNRPSYFFLWIGIVFLLFDGQYWLMANLPGVRNEQCVIGAGLTSGNILFSLLISIMAGVFFIGFFEIIRKRHVAAGAFSVSTLGLIANSATIFCPLCTFPALSAFSASLTIPVFIAYSPYIKLISVVLLLISLFLINRKLQNNCQECIR